jgi:exodeoxyribonuclease VII large subunit
VSPSFKSPWERPTAGSREPIASSTPRPQMDLLFPADSSLSRSSDFVRPAWKVHELVFEIRGRVEKEYRDLRVEGEISNLRQASSGHVYFTLKDDQSQLPVVLFRGKARLLKFSPKDGLEVQVRGGISVYEDRGQLQLVAESMEPRGKGSLQVAFEQLYTLLKEEGLFESDRKRPLPMYPRTIGVITSQKGAVIHDILNVLARRHSRAHVLLYPVAVQGEAAAGEVVDALAWFQKNPCVDVLIVARGGGSPEDLAAFNSEGVARAISASAIPVVSAVGHETDFTIADFVADLRAPTPSIAAEIITDAQYRVEEYLDRLAARLERAVGYRRMLARERFAQLNAAAVFAGVQHGLARRQQRVDELRFRLESSREKTFSVARQRINMAQAHLMRQDVRRQMALHGEHLRAFQTGLDRAWNAYKEHCRTHCSRATDRLWALSPLAVLDRGYALVYDGNGSLVKTSENLHAGDGLRLRFAQGQARAKVIDREAETERKTNQSAPGKR